MAVIPRLFIGLFLTATPEARDVYFEQTTITSTDGSVGGPGVVSRVWCAGRKMRMEAGDVLQGPALILRLDTAKAYRLEPSRKVAVLINTGRLRSRSQADLALAGELMGGEASARTSALPAGKTIAGYRCRGYRITAGSTVMDLYLTKAIPLKVDAFTDFLEWSGASEALKGLVTEIRRLPGFPLETRSRVTVLGQVHETLSTVTKVSVGRHPAELFEPPADYRIEEEPQE